MAILGLNPEVGWLVFSHGREGRAVDTFLNIEQYRETIGLSQNLSSMGPQIPGFFWVLTI